MSVLTDAVETMKAASVEIDRLRRERDSLWAAVKAQRDHHCGNMNCPEYPCAEYEGLDAAVEAAIDQVKP